MGFIGYVNDLRRWCQTILRGFEVLVWSGLRGAVSLLLAIFLVQDADARGNFRERRIAEEMLELTAAIALLTNCINGATISWLLATRTQRLLSLLRC